MSGWRAPDTMTAVCLGLGYLILAIGLGCLAWVWGFWFLHILAIALSVVGGLYLAQAWTSTRGRRVR